MWYLLDSVIDWDTANVGSAPTGHILMCPTIDTYVGETVSIWFDGYHDSYKTERLKISARICDPYGNEVAFDDKEENVSPGNEIRLWLTPTFDYPGTYTASCFLYIWI